MGPGQTLAYAVGRASGGLPLAVLEAKVQAWLSRQQAPGG
jgi:uncharacterized protein (DUF885 family)